MMRAGLALLCCLVASCDQAASQATQVIALVQADSALVPRLKTIVARVIDPDNQTTVDEGSFDLGEQGVRLPFSFGIRKNQLDRFALRVSGFDAGGRELLERTLLARFENRSTLLVEVYLGDVCVDRDCPVEESCSPFDSDAAERGRCQPLAEPELRRVEPGQEHKFVVVVPDGTPKHWPSEMPIEAGRRATVQDAGVTQAQPAAATPPSQGGAGQASANVATKTQHVEQDIDSGMPEVTTVEFPGTYQARFVQSLTQLKGSANGEKIKEEQVLAATWSFTEDGQFQFETINVREDAYPLRGTWVMVDKVINFSAQGSATTEVQQFKGEVDGTLDVNQNPARMTMNWSNDYTMTAVVNGMVFTQENSSAYLVLIALDRLNE